MFTMEGATAVSAPVNFGLLQNYWKIFFLKVLVQKMQNLGLLTHNFGKILRRNLEFDHT